MTIDLGDGVNGAGRAIKMEFVWIPPGKFTMGSPASEAERDADEGAQHEVTISEGFWMGKYEVTQEQWERLMGTNPSYFKNAGKRAPVENVSWNDCRDFLENMNSVARRQKP